MSNLISVSLDLDELRELAVTAEISLFEAIREDHAIDNIRWVATRIKLIDKLMRANGEEGIL